jgi:hypothetical protein
VKAYPPSKGTTHTGRETGFPSFLYVVNETYLAVSRSAGIKILFRKY